MWENGFPELFCLWFSTSCNSSHGLEKMGGLFHAPGFSIELYFFDKEHICISVIAQIS